MAVSWEPEAPAQAGPTSELAYGGFWVRALAFILDSIAVSVVTGALAPLVGAGSMFNLDPARPETYVTANAFSTLMGLIYYVGFWGWRGQTPGMMPFNLRIVRADDGQSIDYVRAFLRYIGLIISFLVIFIGVIWVAFDGRKQGWHDKIAGTLVVRPR